MTASGVAKFVFFGKFLYTSALALFLDQGAFTFRDLFADDVLYIERGDEKYTPLTTCDRPLKDVIHIDFSNVSYLKGVQRCVELRPSIRSVVLGGRFFEIGMLDAVHQLPHLKLVVLDHVSREVIIEARKAWPETIIWESQRSAIVVLRKVRDQELTGSDDFIIERRKLPAGFPEIDDTHAEYVIDFRRRILGNVKTPPLSKKELRQVPNLSTLKALDLSDSDIDDNSLKTILAPLQLEFLDLNGTPITGTGLQSVEAADLKELNLSKTDFSGDWLQRFTQLEILDLHSTDFSNGDIDSIRNLHSLHTLDLRETRVNSEGISKLGTLKGLKKLFIDEELKETEGVKRLKSDNMNLEVSFQG